MNRYIIGAVAAVGIAGAAVAACGGGSSPPSGSSAGSSSAEHAGGEQGAGGTSSGGWAYSCQMDLTTTIDGNTSFYLDTPANINALAARREVTNPVPVLTINNNTGGIAALPVLLITENGGEPITAYSVHQISTGALIENGSPLNPGTIKAYLPAESSSSTAPGQTCTAQVDNLEPSGGGG